VLAHRKVHVEVAVGTVAYAAFAAAAQANAAAVVDAGRNLDGERLVLVDAPASATDVTRLLHDLTFALTLTAGRLRDELPERRLAHLARDSGCAAAVARHDERAGFRAAAFARGARGKMPERYLALRPGERLFERDLDVVAQIAPALRTVRPGGRCATGALLAEKHVEDVAEALGGKSAGALLAGMSEPIVVRPLLRVGEHFVGFVDGFEVIFGGGLIGGDVGMIFPGQLTVRALDLALGRRPRHAEDFVVISRHV
jgi:hypothetical protein